MHYDLITFAGTRTPSQCSATSMSDIAVGTPLGSPCVTRRVTTSPLRGTRGPLVVRGDSCGELQGKRTNTVVIGGCLLSCVRKLGRGSFATVWEARLLDGNNRVHGSDSVMPESGLAVKISNPTNDQLHGCILEAEILQQLAKSLPQDIVSANRVPRYFSHCGGTDVATSTSGSSQTSQVLVAMSKLDGKALDQWLYGVDENRLKTISMDVLFDTPLPGGQLATRSISAACAASAELISQMAPVFAALNKIAYHRDVSAHNFLVRGTAGNEDFSLLDFGLATTAAEWSEDWKRKNICGDPRYFTPAAWMLMTFGSKSLEVLPDTSIRRQYIERIDHYSFGVLVLELLFAMWCGPEKEEEVKGDQLFVITAAMRAWRFFWTDAMVFFQKFHTEGASSTRKAMAKSSTISNFIQKQAALCVALRVASRKLQNSVVSSVFAIAADLIDPRGTMEWPELPQILAKTESPSTADVPGCPEQGLAGATCVVDASPSVATSLESAMGWLAVALTRGVLDLAWVGADKPKGKSKRRKSKAAIC